MNGNASVPVVGSEFAKLNPPMSARAGMPLQVPVYLVEGLPRSFTDVNEAREHAGHEAYKRQASVKLLQGIIALDNFELLETIEPTAQPAAGEGLQGPHFDPENPASSKGSSPRVDEVFAEIQESFAAEKAGTAADRVPFAVGDSLLFLYPRHPFNGVQSILEPHFIRVDRIVDLMEEPLDREEAERQPLKWHDRFMIHGTRIDTGAICEFALCIMRELQTVRVVSNALTKERQWGPDSSRPNSPNHRVPGVMRLDKPDLERLIEAIHECSGFEALFVLALTSDLRQVELLALEWDDIDLPNAKVYAMRTVKGSEVVANFTNEREVQLDPEAVRALEFHRARQQAAGYSGKLVFPSTEWMQIGGEPAGIVSKRAFRDVWQTVRTEAELPDLRFGDLRNNARPASVLLSFHQWLAEPEPAAV